jgi:signal peptidase I
MSRVYHQKPAQKESHQGENPWVEAIKTIGLSAVLAFGIRTFVAEARYIPSGSMLPTLEINDRLLIEKISYRFREPDRGDIVVFSPPEALREQNFNQAFIKRVIGLPGDSVEVRSGQVYVNDQLIEEDYIQEAPEYEYPEVTVPEKHYLVLGDNRNNSYDSHYWGFVPQENIIGRAAVRFWPVGRVGVIEDELLDTELNQPATN